MLCDFYPIPTDTNSTNLGLPISIPEILLIICVTSYAADEVHEVTLFISIHNIKYNIKEIYKVYFL